MSVESQIDAVPYSPLALEWRNGGLEVSETRQPEDRQIHYQDHDRPYTALQNAITEVEMVFAYAKNGISAMLSFLPLALNALADIKDENSFAEQKAAAKRFDLLIEQIGQVANDSSIDDVNLLHDPQSPLRVPYFECSIVANDDRYLYETYGISVSAIREPIEETDEFIGVYVVSSNEEKPVIWINSFSLWMDSLQSDEVDAELINQEINQLADQLILLQGKLFNLESQFDQYTKMVGASITDHLQKI